MCVDFSERVFDCGTSYSGIHLFAVDICSARGIMCEDKVEDNVWMGGRRAYDTMEDEAAAQ